MDLRQVEEEEGISQANQCPGKPDEGCRQSQLFVGKESSDMSNKTLAQATEGRRSSALLRFSCGSTGSKGINCQRAWSVVGVGQVLKHRHKFFFFARRHQELWCFG